MVGSCSLAQWQLQGPNAWLGAKDTVRWYTNDVISFYPRLMVRSCGSAQWRLQGPNTWSGARDTVKWYTNDIYFYPRLMFGSCGLAQWRLQGPNAWPGVKDTVRWYTNDMISFYPRLMVGSCGSAQWRLQGPNTWSGAKETVRKVPVTEMMHYSGLAVLVLVPLMVYWLLSVLRFIFTWHGVSHPIGTYTVQYDYYKLTDWDTFPYTLCPKSPSARGLVAS